MPHNRMFFLLEISVFGDWRSILKYILIENSNIISRKLWSKDKIDIIYLLKCPSIQLISSIKCSEK